MPQRKVRNNLNGMKALATKRTSLVGSCMGAYKQTHRCLGDLLNAMEAKCMPTPWQDMRLDE